MYPNPVRLKKQKISILPKSWNFKLIFVLSLWSLNYNYNPGHKKFALYMYDCYIPTQGFYQYDVCLPSLITDMWPYVIMSVQGFPNGIDWWGGQFGQNGQKLHENYRISIFGSKQWRGTWECKVSGK